MKRLPKTKLKVGMLIQVKDRLIHPTAYRDEWMFADAVITEIAADHFVAEGTTGKVYHKNFFGAYTPRPIQLYVDQDLHGWDPFSCEDHPVTDEDIEEIKACWDWYYQRGFCKFE